MAAERLIERLIAGLGVRGVMHGNIAHAKLKGCLPARIAIIASRPIDAALVQDGRLRFRSVFGVVNNRPNALRVPMAARLHAPAPRAGKRGDRALLSLFHHSVFHVFCCFGR